MSPEELLAAARQLAERGDGTWIRTAAHLARQALEGAIRREIIQQGATPDELPFAAQILGLEGSLADRKLAREVGWTWSALSQACHHHAYDLPPGHAELTRWMDSVERLLLARAG